MAKLPASDAQVFQQSLPLYHWNTSCPLADATSLRTGTKKAAANRESMTRQAAEKKALGPCVYCLDME